MALTHGPRHETPTRNKGTVIDFEGGQGTAPRKPAGRHERRGGHRRLIVGGALAGVGATAVAVVAAVSGGGSSKPAHRAVQRHETAPAASAAPQLAPEKTTPSTAAPANISRLPQSFAGATREQICGNIAIQNVVETLIGSGASCAPAESATSAGNFNAQFTAASGDAITISVEPRGTGTDPIEAVVKTNPYLPPSSQREAVKFDGTTAVAGQQQNGVQTGIMFEDGSHQNLLEVEGFVGGKPMDTPTSMRIASVVVGAL